MRQKTLLKTMLLLCAFVAGSGSAWADEYSSGTIGTLKSGDNTINNVNWSVSMEGSTYFSSETQSPARGSQFGSKNNPATSVTLSTSAISGTISSVVVHASAYSSSASIAVSVGGTSYGSNNLTSSDAAYTFNGSSSGDISIVLTNASSGGRAMYIKSITVTCSTDSRANSDLTITSSSSVGLTMTTANPAPTSTITWETSSTGAMTFTSNATDVATVSNEGVITAVGPGTATITISQAADDDYKASGDLTVTVNVTDSRDAVATGIDLSSAKTILKDATGSITATSTKANGFSGEITYTFETADASIFSIAEGNYTGAGIGATTVTITATPTGGNANAYKAASQEVAVTVNGTNSISLDKTSHSEVYSPDVFTLSATVPTENYNGTVSAESSNTNVATVSVEGTTVTVTPKAVGSATITVTAEADTYYPSAATATCSVTFTAPEGKTTKPASTTILFNETFNQCDGTGGRDDEFSGNIGTSSTSGKLDETWATISSNAAKECIKLGTSSATGTVTTKNIPLTGNGTLTFSAAGWATGTNTVTVSATNATLSGDKNVTLVASTWKNYTVNITEATGSVAITFSIKRGFLDDVVVTAQGEDVVISTNLNSEGYATFCSEYPLDFSDYETADYSAWQITSANSTTGVITFSQITGSVKGGTGILLKGTAGDPVTLTSVDSSEELDDNLLVGTLAPTIVAANEYYGLSGKNFVPVNAGTVKAGKALLPASEVSGARQLTFVFEGTQGISTVEHSTLSTDDAIYSISGQRVSTPKKGLYIVNGKKVLVK